MNVFMSNGKVENDDWNEIAKTFANDVKPTDNIDAIILTDRRHQTFANKLRYPSGQVHFYTADECVPHLEKLCLAMKQSEMSDWIAELSGGNFSNMEPCAILKFSCNSVTHSPPIQYLVGNHCSYPA